MSTTTPSVTTEIDSLLARLPVKARHWIYLAAIVIGGVIFVVTITLDAVGHGHIGGLNLNPATGIVGAILTLLGMLAHANLSSGPGILAAIEDEVPAVSQVVSEATADVEKVKAVVEAHPEIETYTVKVLKTELAKVGITTGLSSKTKAELQTLLRDAIVPNATS